MKVIAYIRRTAALLPLLFLSPLAFAQETTQNGSLVTNDDKGISGDRLRELLDEYIPTDNAHSTLIVLTQCFGGNMVDALANGRDNTGVTSATSKGEEAEYGGYDDDAAGALKPGAGRTSDDVHEAGTNGKAAGETPTKAGDTISLEPVDPVNGPIKSRHIIVYAGSPDGNATTSDEEQLQTIKDNFANEPNTDVTSVGGDGTGNWDHPGTEEGLKAALKEIQAKMNVHEQFIMFITDHGDQDVTDPTCTEDGFGNYFTDPLRLEASVYPAMLAEPDNVAALTVFVPTAQPPPPFLLSFGDMFTTAFFDTRVDLDNDGIQDPGDGWEAWIPVNEQSLDPNSGNIAVMSNLPPRLPVSVRLSSGAIPKIGSGGGCGIGGQCNGAETLRASAKSKRGACQAKAVIKQATPGQVYAIRWPSGDCASAIANDRGKAIAKQYPAGSGVVTLPDCGLSANVVCP